MPPMVTLAAWHPTQAPDSFTSTRVAIDIDQLAVAAVGFQVGAELLDRVIDDLDLLQSRVIGFGRGGAERRDDFDPVAALRNAPRGRG